MKVKIRLYRESQANVCSQHIVDFFLEWFKVVQFMTHLILVVGNMETLDLLHIHPDVTKLAR